MKKIVTWLKHSFIPHEGNEKQPHVLRSKATTGIIIASIVVELFVLVALFPFFGKSLDFIASVLPGVLVDEANKTRLAYNLNTLQSNPLLVEAAQLKANDMAERGYFAHNTPDGDEPWIFLQQVGYAYETAGENLAVNFSDSIATHEAWMNSPGHRANIVRNSFTEIGIATARGEYEGRSTIFVVQFFGKPRTAVVPTQVAVNPTPAPIPVPTPAPTQVQIAVPAPINIPTPRVTIPDRTIPNPIVPPPTQTSDNVASESVVEKNNQLAQGTSQNTVVENESSDANNQPAPEVSIETDENLDATSSAELENEDVSKDSVLVSNQDEASSETTNDEKGFIRKILDSIGRFANGVAQLVHNITVAMLGGSPIVQRDAIPTESTVESANTSTFVATGTVSEVDQVEYDFEPEVSLLSRLASSPRTVSALIFGLLSLVIVVALILKVLVHVNVQFIKLILNGVLILVVLFTFLLINHELAGYLGKVL